MAGLGAFVAGLGSGYLRGQQQALENERQAKRDAMLEEQFQWSRDEAADKRRERENRLAIEKAISDSANAGQVDNNGAAVTYTDESGQQKTAYQPDLEAANAAAQQQAIETGGPMPTAEKASSVRTLDGGRKLFTGLTAAQQAKAYADENAPGNYSKYMALSEKLATMAGGQELADKYLARAKQADKEGAFKALSLLNADRPEEALKVWNSTGASRLQDGQTFKTVTDKAGNKVHQVVDRDGKVLVPDAEAALVRHISGIEGVVSASNAKATAAAKIREELYKPYTLKPGEKREVVDPATGKTVTLSEGNIPAGYEVMTDPNGNTILRRMDGAGGAGTGAGKGKVEDPLKATQDMVFDIIKESAAKGSLEPGQVARAGTLSRQLVSSAAREGRSLDGAVAAEIAINAATGKIPVTPSFNPSTGTIDNVVEYQGNKFAVENLGTATNSRLDPKQMSSIAVNYIGSIPEARRASVVAAAYNPQARAKFNSEIEQSVRSQDGVAALAQRLGRQPTSDELKIAVKAAQDATAPSLELISRYTTLSDAGKDLTKGIAKGAGYTADFKSQAQKSTQGSASKPGDAGATPSPVADIEAKFKQEDSEMVRGTRTQYSPEVRKYYEEKARKEAEQRQQGDQEYLKREQQRMLQNARGLAPSYR